MSTRCDSVVRLFVSSVATTSSSTDQAWRAALGFVDQNRLDIGVVSDESFRAATRGDGELVNQPSKKSLVAVERYVSEMWCGSVCHRHSDGRIALLRLLAAFWRHPAVASSCGECYLCQNRRKAKDKMTTMLNPSNTRREGIVALVQSGDQSPCHGGTGAQFSEPKLVW